MAKKQVSVARIKRRQTFEQEQNRRLPTWGWFAIGGAVAIVLVIGLFYLDSRSLRGGVNVARDIDGVQIFPEPGRSHLNGDIDYNVAIPAGGPHNPVWQNCGIYEEPVRTENALHSMEHGAVWIAYDPNLPAEEIDQLRELVRQERASLRTFYILAPKEDIPAPIVATAWRAQIELESAFDERLTQFMQRFHLGPYTPERGATCSGGVGEPIS